MTARAVEVAVAMRSGTERRAPRPFSVAAGGVRLAVRLTPRAKRNGIDGIVLGADDRPALQLRVAAPPVEGAANAALIAFIAGALELRKSDIRIVSGQTARVKILELSGDGAAIMARLNAWIAQASARHS